MLFLKFSIFPATQNKDERLFSMVGRTTGALSRFICVLEKKLSSKEQKHGFMFHYKNGVDSNMMEMTAPKSRLRLFKKQ